MSSSQTKNYCYLAKVHTFDSFTAQGWTNWRTWACLTSSDDELHDLIPGCHFSRHLELLVRRSGVSLDDEMNRKRVEVGRKLPLDQIKIFAECRMLAVAVSMREWITIRAGDESWFCRPSRQFAKEHV
jgi:hypothetical protein